MSRIALSDGSGWFDPEAAVCFEEDRFWNGQNHISRATGSQWDHETLYYTRSGNWVLHWSSQWEGTIDTYHRMEPGEAARWLVSNGHADRLAELPDAVRALIDGHVAEAEV